MIQDPFGKGIFIYDLPKYVFIQVSVIQGRKEKLSFYCLPSGERNGQNEYTRENLLSEAYTVPELRLGMELST